MRDLKAIIRDAWKITVKEFYNDHRIHNEFSLQTAIYHGLHLHGLEKDYKVFVEASWSGENTKNTGKEKIPDIIITQNKNIVCLIEIKCTPHRTLRNDLLIKDIKKLDYFSKFNDNITLSYFGPTRTGKDLKFENNEIPIFKIDKNAIYAFACIAESKSETDNLEKLNEFINQNHICSEKLPNFMLLTGVVEYKINDKQSSNFEVYPK